MHNGYINIITNTSSSSIKLLLQLLIDQTFRFSTPENITAVNARPDRSATSPTTAPLLKRPKTENRPAAVSGMAGVSKCETFNGCFPCKHFLA
ncbi:hypothetical protein HanHA300_Chr14g0507321 [Helianthus annuus]|nr:hypothetical protein HanHA300_Chr14g0507321 [Helianthus annuus]KAJ0484056.1 hypothetical protein HanHA89_Chr14g0539871 [Helianthus annuus]KAJ0799342.1 hypothetical protein HanOQP8_Chr00c719g0850681 [Helianthus annuus]